MIMWAPVEISPFLLSLSTSKKRPQRRASRSRRPRRGANTTAHGSLAWWVEEGGESGVGAGWGEGQGVVLNTGGSLVSPVARMLGRARQGCGMMGRVRAAQHSVRNAALPLVCADRRLAAQPRRALSSASDGAEAGSLFTPTEVHGMLREAARTFAENQVDPQGMEYDKAEKFNLELFRQVGEQGYLGVTVPEEYGGQGLDATASVIIHEALAAADPGFLRHTATTPTS